MFQHTSVPISELRLHPNLCSYGPKYQLCVVTKPHKNRMCVYPSEISSSSVLSVVDITKTVADLMKFIPIGPLFDSHLVCGVTNCSMGVVSLAESPQLRGLGLGRCMCTSTHTTNTITCNMDSYLECIRYKL